MSSRTLRWLLPAIVGLPLVLTGCQLPIDEGLPPSLEKEQKLGQGTQCLGDVLPVMDAFMEGTATAKDIDATWECFASAIDLFQKNTRGNYADRFLSRELANFFERYFLKDTKISDRLLVEIFHLKQLFVGGSADSMTRDELSRLADFARLLKRVSIRLLPYMQIISMKWNLQSYRSFNADIRYFEATNLELQRAAKEIGEAIEKNGQSYQLQNFIVLCEEVAKLYSGNWDWLAELRRIMPLVQKLKKSLAGGDEASIAATEWKRFTLLGGRGYVQYLRYHYFIENKEIVGGGPELIYIARSIDDLFSYLGEMVGDKPGAILTRAELLEILEAVSKFFPEFHPSDAFLIEVMKIKQVFFGGSLENWKKDDFDLARSKVDAFRVLIERFLAYVSVYGLSWDPREVSEIDAQNYFETAEKNILEFAQRLGTIMETPYNLNDIIKFAEEWDKLIVAKREGTLLAPTLRKYIPVVIATKNIVFSDEDSLLGRLPGQWSDFLVVGAQVYSRYMYYYFFLRKLSLYEGASLSSLEKMVRQCADLLDSLIDRKLAKPEPVISFFELNRLLKAGFTAQLMPDKVSGKTVEDLALVLFQKILITPEHRLTGSKASGLGREATQVLRTEFATWFENQRFLEIIFSGLPLDGRKSPEQVLSDLGQATPTVGINEFKAAISTPISLAVDDKGRILLARKSLDYDRKSLTLINLSRSAVRLIIRSYAQDIDRIKSYQGINKIEVNSLLADGKPLASELGILNPGDLKFADNRFRDGNLLLPRSNGNSYLDFREATDLLMFLLSGLQVDDLLSVDLEKTCPIKAAPYKEDSTLDATCAFEYYKGHIAAAYSSMPDFMAAMSALPIAEQNDFLRALFAAGGYLPNQEKQIRLGDFALIPHAAQYIEGIFQLYDVDVDGVLNTREAMKAFPTFKTLLAEIGGISSEKQLRGLFAYLLFYKKPPATMWEKIKFILFWVPKGEKGWNVSASRDSLAKILGTISTATKDKAKALAIKIQPSIQEITIEQAEAIFPNIRDEQNNYD